MTFLAAPPRLTEARFMAQLITLAELHGWKAYHTYSSRRSAAGFPDLVLVRRPRVVWAEVKAQRTRATTAQLDWIRELRACGQEVFLWRPSDWDKIERILSRRTPA